MRTRRSDAPSLLSGLSRPPEVRSAPADRSNAVATRPDLASDPATRPEPSFFGKVAHALDPARLGAAVGRLLKQAGVAVLGAIVGRGIGLPKRDASLGTVEVRGLSVAAIAEAQAKEAPSKKLAAAFDGLKTIGGGPGEARLLEDNLHAWNARWEMLASATDRIDSSYFIVEKDPFGFAFLGHLLKKQREGVDVRLMIDAMADTFGAHGFKMPGRGQDYLQELAASGSEIAIYHPVSQRPTKIAGYAALASNHDKIIVVDGKRSMTGGRNIGIEYFASPKDMPEAWRDTDVQLVGEGPAAGLTEAVNREFEHEDILSRVQPDLFGNWVKRDVELIGAYVMMDEWLNLPAYDEADKEKLRGNLAAQHALAKDLVKRTLARLPAEGVDRPAEGREKDFLQEQALRLVEQLDARGSRAEFEKSRHRAHHSDVKILDQTSVAGERENDFDVALVQLADAAEKSIVIENPYVVLTEDMIQALSRAADRGVEVIIGTNSPLSTDSAVTQAFFLKDWPHILARVPTARIFVASGDRKLHAKVATIDDEVSVVSTYNMDLLSGYVNSEVGAVVKSEAFNRDLKASFVRDRDNPANGVLEYTIEKDAEGRAVLKDGAPVVTFGPEDHLSEQMLADYADRMQTWGIMRDNLPYFKPLRHPKLVPEGGTTT